MRGPPGPLLGPRGPPRARGFDLFWCLDAHDLGARQLDGRHHLQAGAGGRHHVRACRNVHRGRRHAAGRRRLWAQGPRGWCVWPDARAAGRLHRAGAAGCCSVRAIVRVRTLGGCQRCLCGVTVVHRGRGSRRRRRGGGDRGGCRGRRDRLGLGGRFALGLGGGNRLHDLGHRPRCLGRGLHLDRARGGCSRVGGLGLLFLLGLGLGAGRALGGLGLLDVNLLAGLHRGVRDRRVGREPLLDGDGKAHGDRGLVVHHLPRREFSRLTSLATMALVSTPSSFATWKILI